MFSGGQREKLVVWGSSEPLLITFLPFCPDFELLKNFLGPHICTCHKLQKVRLNIDLSIDRSYKFVRQLKNTKDRRFLTFLWGQRKILSKGDGHLGGMDTLREAKKKKHKNKVGKKSEKFSKKSYSLFVI